MATLSKITTSLFKTYVVTPDKVRLDILNRELELTVMDDGVGLPVGLDWKNTNRLGLKLIRVLVEDQAIIAMDIESCLLNSGFKVTSTVDTGKKRLLKQNKTNQISFCWIFGLKGRWIVK
ncbi:hypothetical protein KKA14_19970 [bacterium]|nr:hypothetical protein [bacterium]